MGSRNNKPGRIVKGTAKQPSLKEASGIWTLDEALQAHRANAWPQPNLLQPIPKSLRFGQSKNTLLKSIPSRTSGDTGTFTISFWIKMGKIASDMAIFSADDSSASNIDLFRFKADGGARFLIESASGGSYYYMETLAVWRDPSAWQHWVVTLDTRQATDTNRAKIYVNGVQQSLTVTAAGIGTYPPQGWKAKYFGKAGIAQWIGAYYLGGAHFDGELAEFNFVDGFAVDPSLFGQTGTDGVWIPKEYTGSRGTNGFYLSFTDNTNSQTLGYDDSNFTAYDDDKDPYRSHVALHLTGNGPAGGQNNTFTDSSSNNHSVTRTGTVTQGSLSPFPYDASIPYNPIVHGASGYFPGSSKLSMPDSDASFNFGSGDYTIEAWCWPLTSGNTSSVVFNQSNGGAGSNSAIYLGFATDGASHYISDGTGWDYNASVSGKAYGSEWHHVAWVRNGTTIRIYVDGISVASSSIPAGFTLGNSSRIVEIGSQNSEQFYTGHISNVRVIRGVALYTSDFIPPRRPFGTETKNILTNNSENFQYWFGGGGLTITPNAAVAPDGTPTANLCVPSTSSTSQNVACLISSPAGINTFSVYAKYAGYKYVQVLLSRTADNDAGYVTYDIQAGTVHNSGVWTGSIENVGNGWYRLIANTSSFPGVASGSNVRWFVTDGTNSRGPAFAGNGTSGVYLWGAQAEAGSSATSYAPVPENFNTAPSLLLKFENAAVVDSAGTTNITTNTAATISANNKYGLGSIYVDGSASTFLSLPYNSNFQIGSSDYTIETWINVSTYGEIIGAFNISSPFPGWLVGLNFSGSGKMAFFHANGSVNQTVAGNTTVPTNTWTHLAWVKQNNFMKMFINGRLDSSFSLTLTSTGSGQQINIGADANSLTAPGRRMVGYLDDLRITKGIARYWDNFTPPSRALPTVGGKSFITNNITAGVVRSFTTTGTTSWTAPADVTQVEVLVVAGGGGGGAYNNPGGGGGGGGLIYNNQYPVTPGQTYTVTVGVGGTADRFPSLQTGTNGGNSVFGALTAIGGGRGSTTSNAGSLGGSGGGGNYESGAAGGSGTAGQGFAGGSGAGYTGNTYASGGGGGAGGVGSNGVFGSSSGNGGPGLQFGISGTPTYYAGGGGGAMYQTGTAGSGGAGGGGAGGSSSVVGTAGTANTGGGGGGGSNAHAGDGGSGIVILRYTTAYESSSTTDDSLVDSPTSYGHDLQAGGEVIGNYATWNPLIGANYNTSSVIGSSIVVFSEGNLKAYNPANGGHAPRMQAHSNTGMTRGKWYAEFTGLSGRGAGISLGDYLPSGGSGSGVSNSLILQPTTGVVNPSTGASATITGTAVPVSSTDVVGVAFDVDNNTCYFYRNGVLTQTASNITTTPGSPYFSSGTWYFSSQPESSGSPSTIIANFGQRPWVYRPPAGFNALNTKNLPVPTGAAANPNQYFDTVLYTGNGSSQTVSGLNFQPDFVWIKGRSGTTNHNLVDSLRGTSSTLFSSTNGAENASVQRVTAFTANGFSVGNDSDVNTSTATYVAWCWKASNSTATNTSGSVSSSVRANTTAGFSIVGYAGSQVSDFTIGHGLSQAPELIITKQRNTTGNWGVYYTVRGTNTNWVMLNATDVQGSQTGSLTGGAFVISNASTLQISSSSFANGGSSMIAYCWHSVPGFSQIGTYTGNGSADGPFVYCGFKPRFIIGKDITNSAGGNNWWIFDSVRDTFNGGNSSLLRPNLGDAELANSNRIDIVSNGFKIRSAGALPNDVVNAVYVYMAFAELPFKTARSR